LLIFQIAQAKEMFIKFEKHHFTLNILGLS